MALKIRGRPHRNNFRGDDFRARQRIPTFSVRGQRSTKGASASSCSLLSTKKKRATVSSDQGHSTSTNPQRLSAKRRQKNRDEYFYELAQYNRRRKVARQILQSENKSGCPRFVADVQKQFEEVFEKVKNATRPSYELGGSAVFEPAVVTEGDINAAIKGMSLDVAPGLDGVILRTIKELTESNTIATIATIMLDTSWTSSSLFEGRTVLQPKDPSDLGN